MAGFDNKYPYTDFHELNLDWFLARFKEVTDQVTTLDATVQEFTAFVTNYFDNLDVQQEINNKLDKMAADGTLSALIQPLFDEYKVTIDDIVEQQDDTIATQNQKITQLTGRVDQLATINPGSITTTADAELVDIRVEFDGTTAASAGDAVRAQATLLNNKIVDMDLNSINILQKTNGVPTDDGWMFTLNSNYQHIAIPVNGGEHLTIHTHATQYSYIAVVKTYSGTGSAPDYSDAAGFTARITIGYNVELNYHLPSDARYIIYVTKYNGNNATPKHFILNGYDERITAKKNLMNITGENRSDIDKVIPQLYQNLVDPAKMLTDKYITTSGTIGNAQAGLGYYVSDYIEVLGSDIAGDFVYNSSVACAYAVYDEYKNFLRATQLASGCYEYQSGDYYIRVSGIVPEGYPMVNYGDTKLPYVAYGKIYGISECVELKEDVDVIKNKFPYIEYLIDDIVALGDSTCQGLVSDYPYLRSTNNRWSYVNYMCKSNNWHARNEGHSGYNAKDWIANIYAPGTYGDFQIALIDFGYNETIPNTLSTDVEPYEDYHDYADTPCGNYCKVIGILKDENPNMIIIPIIQARASSTNIETIKAIAEYFSLSYIDLTVSDLNDSKYHGYYSAETYEQETKDFIHFNLVGYARKGAVVKEGIIKILLDNPEATDAMVASQQAAQYS